MFTKLHQIVFAALAAASFHDASACCALSPWYYDTVSCAVGDRQAMIVTAGLSNGVTRDTAFVDTLYFQEFFDRLKASYASSDLVFIAKVTRAVSFMPPIDSLGQEVFASESVTVTIEEVLKGSPQPLTSNFISRDMTDSRRWILDSLTGEIRVGIMQMSISEPHFASVLNDRYLFFLKKNDFSTGEGGTFQRMLQGICDPSSYSYKIDLNNEIYYDGFEYDTLRKSVSNIPEITCPLDTFTNEVLFPSATGRPLVVGNGNQLKAPEAIYNLLGKRLSRTDPQAQFRQTPGLYIHAGSGHHGKTRTDLFRNPVGR